MGLIDNVIIDTHFVERGRFSRLMEIVSMNPNNMGIGLGEDAGIIVEDGCILRAIGSGITVILDGSHLKYTNVANIDSDDAIAIENLLIHTMVHGYGYDLSRKKYLKPEDLSKWIRTKERKIKMKINEMRALRGPNYYSRHPVIFMRLDLLELEEKPTDMVSGFKDQLSKMMPSMYEHKCSIGTIGGFFERLDRGTWAGHVTEHVALEFQCLSGYEVAFGKTYDTEEYGIYNLVFRYLEENVGLRAGEMAVKIVEDLFRGKTTDVEPLIVELKKNGERSLLGPSTQSIVDEATKRRIPISA